MDVWVDFMKTRVTPDALCLEENHLFSFQEMTLDSKFVLTYCRVSAFDSPGTFITLTDALHTCFAMHLTTPWAQRKWFVSGRAHVDTCVMTCTETSHCCDTRWSVSGGSAGPASTTQWRHPWRWPVFTGLSGSPPQSGNKEGDYLLWLGKKALITSSWHVIVFVLCATHLSIPA